MLLAEGVDVCSLCRGGPLYTHGVAAGLSRGVVHTLILWLMIVVAAAFICT